MAARMGDQPAVPPKTRDAEDGEGEYKWVGGGGGMQHAACSMACGGGPPKAGVECNYNGVHYQEELTTIFFVLFL